MGLPLEVIQRQPRNLDSGRTTAFVVLVCSLSLLVGCCHIATVPTDPATTVTPNMPFPGPGDFAGGYIPQPVPVKNGLQSTYSGTVIVGVLDRSAIEKVIPVGFTLAKQINASTQHPVIFLVGDQREPSFLESGNVTTICKTCGYREMILLVPFVVREAGDRWHNYAVRMYLDDPAAVAGGNSIYGYAKQWASLAKSVSAGVTKYEILPLFGGLLFQSEMRITGPWVPVSVAPASVPRWADLEKVFKAPVLGQQPADTQDPLVFICSYWEWDFTNAEVAPAAGSYRVVRKFRDGMENWVSATPLPNAPDGAVSMRGVRWRLATPPEGCQGP